jgi:hypothetical protein
MNNDTLEFNTENFKTQPNAVVEDLLKKLPGVVVDADGTVRVNGQKINRVLVNGKEFFTGDPKLATKNLDADAVDKVQVFDKKSDRAAFTGVDDGQSEKAINLKLKKDRNKSLFGKVSDPSEIIRTAFAANYVVSDTHHGAFEQKAEADPNMRLVYRDRYNLIWEIIPHPLTMMGAT